MQKYKFYYKKRFFWKSETVVGHKLDGNTMSLFYEDGSIMTIPGWDKYALRLKLDWVLAVKKNAESQTGVDIKLNTKA